MSTYVRIIFMKKISIISLGGTITMTSNTSSGAVPSLSAEDLVAAIPEISKIAN